MILRPRDEPLTHEVGISYRLVAQTDDLGEAIGVADLLGARHHHRRAALSYRDAVILGPPSGPGQECSFSTE